MRIIHADEDWTFFQCEDHERCVAARSLQSEHQHHFRVAASSPSGRSSLSDLAKATSDEIFALVYDADRIVGD